MHTSGEFFCSCGELAQDVFYKRIKKNGRQTHHAPSKHGYGDYKDLVKVCPNCDARYSICKVHKTLGFQQWKLEERSSKSCKALTWIHSCKKCDANGTSPTVLCPGCKVVPTQWLSSFSFFLSFFLFFAWFFSRIFNQFIAFILQATFIGANKGPKWYLGLHGRCKWARTRKNCYEKLHKKVETLLSLGESLEDIINRLKSTPNMPTSTSPKPKVSSQPAVNHAKSATSVHCVKTTPAIKPARLECELRASPENCTSESEYSSNTPATLHFPDNGFSDKMEDYNFVELSKFYYQVFLPTWLLYLTCTSYWYMNTPHQQNVEDVPDFKIERKRKRIDGEKENYPSLISLLCVDQIIL